MHIVDRDYNGCRKSEQYYGMLISEIQNKYDAMPKIIVIEGESSLDFHLSSKFGYTGKQIKEAVNASQLRYISGKELEDDEVVQGDATIVFQKFG